jgi:hypothetical protein
MKNLISIISVLFYVNGYSQTAPDSKLLIGKFDGRTPCQELAAILKEPTTPECIKIKWRLMLYRDEVKEDRGTFVLEGFVFRGQNKLTGEWNMSKGTAANPDALVYELTIPGRNNLLFQKVDDNILYFLDQQKNLLVGSVYFSYVLNRVDPKSL